MQDDLGVRKLFLRQRMWNALSALPTGCASVALGAAPELGAATSEAIPKEDAEPGLTALEIGFSAERPTWFVDDPGSGGGDRGSPSGDCVDDDCEDRQVRNWRPVDEGHSRDLPALAGLREKEALRLLRFNLLLEGREIGVERNGLLAKGFLSRAALACLGLQETENYAALWGENGLAVAAAARLMPAEIRAAAAELRSAVAWRLQDEIRRCKLRQAVHIAPHLHLFFFLSLLLFYYAFCAELQLFTHTGLLSSYLLTTSTSQHIANNLLFLVHSLSFPLASTVYFQISVFLMRI